jgi:ATP-dependent helicase HepA
MRRAPGISNGIVAHIFVIPAQAGIQWFCFAQELERLKALQQINPNVRDEEIQFFKQQLQ